MAKNTSTKRKSQQRQASLRLVIMIAILVCVNMLASRFHYSLDLTKEKRFTLSPATKQMLHNMKDVAVIDVYLKGKFPAGFQRLAQATQERLQSFKEYAGTHIVYRFIDPQEGKSPKEKQKMYEEFADKGIEGVNLTVTGGDEGYSQKLIFPDALVHYEGKEKAVKLLDNHSGMTQSEVFNYSESTLEYKFASAIHDLSIPDKPRVAYIVGNNEALGWNTYDALTTIAKNYHLDTLDLSHIVHIPISYDAIIINKPIIPFEEKEKFLIDQYVMEGGKILWMVDMLNTPLDSLRTSQQFVTTDYGLNLDDLLFNYGARINTDLIEDIECVPIPMIVGELNGRPDIQPKKWIYFPVITPSSKHPIVNNMGPILFRFASSIDTIENPGIKKTVLLQSSKYSRVAASPTRVSLSIAQYPFRPEMFNKPFQNVAVLLEGKFHSLYQNRLAQSFVQVFKDSLKQNVKYACDSTNSMIVVSDGDVMNNDFYADRGPMEMGYWDYTKDIFANKSFVLNCLEYLTDHSKLIEARSKDITIRSLDVGRIKNEKSKWQVINIGIPIALILVFASAYLFFRKKRYEKKA